MQYSWPTVRGGGGWCHFLSFLKNGPFDGGGNSGGGERKKKNAVRLFVDASATIRIGAKDSVSPVCGIFFLVIQIGKQVVSGSVINGATPSSW